MSFKDPSFQERIGSAAKAKKALEQLRSKPPLDKGVVAERKAKQLHRESREVEKKRGQEGDPAGRGGQKGH